MRNCDRRRLCSYRSRRTNKSRRSRLRFGCSRLSSRRDCNVLQLTASRHCVPHSSSIAPAIVRISPTPSAPSARGQQSADIVVRKTLGARCAVNSAGNRHQLRTISGCCPDTRRPRTRGVAKAGAQGRSQPCDHQPDS